MKCYGFLAQTKGRQRIMKVVKVINNNLVRTYDENGNEVLAMGCGLGFKKSSGDEIDSSLIEKLYTCNDKANTNQLVKILEKIPFEHIQVTNEIINFARASLGKKLNDNIFISLTDHLNFAIDRHKNGIAIKNALLWEIKKFYNHEYLIGKEALDIINRRLGIQLPEDEAGFIALHLVNASMDEISMQKATVMAKMIQQIINIVKYHFNMELDEYSIHYERFITHVKFFAQRVLSGTIIKDQDEQFLAVLKQQCKDEYACTRKVKEFIKQEYGCDLTEDEMIYLTVHIKRITSK